MQTLTVHLLLVAVKTAWKSVGETELNSVFNELQSAEQQISQLWECQMKVGSRAPELEAAGSCGSVLLSDSWWRGEEIRQ